MSHCDDLVRRSSLITKWLWHYSGQIKINIQIQNDLPVAINSCKLSFPTQIF